MHEPADSLNLSAIALFPLPNVVLFPRAVLPLHVFEFRYRLMTAEVLQGAGLIAMALLKPGWEKQYHDRPAIEPVVCVGQILRYEELDDGKYNLLLQGVLRATIDREYADRPYRYASMNRLPEKSAPESDLIRQRARLLELFSAPPLEGLPISSQIRELLAGPLATPEVADLIAFHFVEPLATQQAVLSEGDVRARVQLVLDVMESQLPYRAIFRPDDRAQWN